VTLTSLLIPVSKVKVGTSDEYPVTKVRTSSKLVGLDDTNTDSYEEITWELECLAEVSVPTSITALNEQLRDQLAKRGLAVTLTELGSARVLPATGTGGSMIGYPRVEISDIPERSFAQYQVFTMRAMTQLPIVDGDGIWQHTRSTETTTSIDGTTITSVSGAVRMAQGNDAAAWVQTNIIGPVRTTAGTNGDAVVSKVKIGNDPAQCEYSYTITPSTTGSVDVTEASVEDRTARDTAGRTVRTVSGYATGGNASTFATGQLLTETANLKLIRKDGPSLPAIPNGRVSFSYQYVSGVTHVDFPGVFITRLDESISQSGGGRELIASAYLQNDPTLRLNRKMPVALNESLTIEFLGSFASINPSRLLDADFQNGQPRITKRSQGIFNTYTRSIDYIYATEPDPLPNPRTMDGLA